MVSLRPLLAAASGLLAAVTASANMHPPSFTLKLWPGLPPGGRVDANYREEIIFRDNNPEKPRVRKVTDPTLEVFLPAPDKATGTAVVVCPGGGYVLLAYDHEGLDVARWLNELGIAGIVLKYRLPSDAIMADRSVGALQDAQEAIRTVRRRASEWRIDPARIGIMGFSAGGHLAATASTLYAEKVYQPADECSARPDFSILAYPVISFRKDVMHGGSRRTLLGDNPSDALVAKFSADEQVNAGTPPAFLVHSADDPAVPIENSIRYFLALRKAGVPGELHAYPKGRHGYGLGIDPDSPKAWPEALEAWLRASGW